jgi:hypothetical protein
LDLSTGALIVDLYDSAWIGQNHHQSPRGDKEVQMAYRYGYRSYSLVFLIYVVIGVFVAVDKHYITVGWLKSVFSALLAVFLWFLVLLGVDLHIH